MLTGPGLSTIFEIFFYVGLFCSILMFVLGHLLDVGGLDGHADVDLHWDMTLHSDVDTQLPVNTIVSPFKPITILSFSTVFGGSGILFLKNNYSPLMACLLALLLGLFVASLLYKFLLVPLYKAGQKSFAITKDDLIGKTGIVNLTIPEDKLGSVTYLVKDNTCTSPACSIDSTTIEEGAQVKIISVEDNILNVRKIV